jgi:ankyrin repeat protein
MHTDEDRIEELFEIAKKGELNQIDTQTLTTKILTTKCNLGSTVLHWAANHGQLKYIPKKFLTEKNLTIKDNEARTAFHLLAYRGFLDQIPQNLITKANLTIEDDNNNTPIQWASYQKHLTQIPYLVLLQLKEECLKEMTTENFKSFLQATKEIYKTELKNKIPQKLNSKNNEHKNNKR